MHAMNPPPSIRSAFTPTGKLRAAINLGNPILANLDAAGNAGRRVGRPGARVRQHCWTPNSNWWSSTPPASRSTWWPTDKADIGFFAIDPLRGEHIAFTAAYVLIEGCYLVKDDSPLRANDEVDRAAHRVVVGKGSAYDLYLTRTLQHAQIVRSPTSPTVVDTFIATRRRRRRRRQAAARSRCAPPGRPAPARRSASW